MKSITNFALLLGLTIIPQVSLLAGPVSGEDAPVVGNWVGWALPEFQFQAPFDQVRFQVTFFDDGTAYWNDGHERRFGHGTGYGA